MDRCQVCGHRRDDHAGGWCWGCDREQNHPAVPYPYDPSHPFVGDR